MSERETEETVGEELTERERQPDRKKRHKGERFMGMYMGYVSCWSTYTLDRSMPKGSNGDENVDSPISLFL